MDVPEEIFDLVAMVCSDLSAVTTLRRTCRQAAAATTSMKASAWIVRHPQHTAAMLSIAAIATHDKIVRNVLAWCRTTLMESDEPPDGFSQRMTQIVDAMDAVVTQYDGDGVSPDRLAEVFDGVQTEIVFHFAISLMSTKPPAGQNRHRRSLLMMCVAMSANLADLCSDRRHVLLVHATMLTVHDKSLDATAADFKEHLAEMGGLFADCMTDRVDVMTTLWRIDRFHATSSGRLAAAHIVSLIPSLDHRRMMIQACMLPDVGDAIILPSRFIALLWPTVQELEPGISIAMWINAIHDGASPSALAELRRVVPIEDYVLEEICPVLLAKISRDDGQSAHLGRIVALLRDLGHSQMCTAYG